MLDAAALALLLYGGAASTAGAFRYKKPELTVATTSGRLLPQSSGIGPSLSVVEHTTSRSFRDADNWFGNAMQKLSSIEQLSTSSNADDVESPNAVAVHWAKMLVEAMHRVWLAPSSIATSADGGVSFCFARNGKYCSIECLNTGEIVALRRARSGAPDIWDVDPSRMEDDLKLILDDVGP